MPEIVDDPQYQQAIGGIRAQLAGGGPPRASPDEQDEYYDSIKEALLQQGLEEAAPKKKERGGIHTVLKFLPGYAAGLQQRQAYDQKDEILNLEKQRQKGITADRQLKMRQQLEEIRLKRDERQQRQAIGSALNQLQQGGLDPQATGELQGQVRQGLIGIGKEKEALEYGRPERLGPKEVNTPFEAILADEAQKGGGPDVYERAIKRYGAYQKEQKEGTGTLEETRTLQRQKLQLDIDKAERAAGGELPPIEKEKFALDIRRSIRQEPSFKDFQDVRSGYQAVITGGRRGDSVGDLALINGLQRIIDPGVSVREGEFKTVAQAQGFLQRLFNSKEKFFEGDLLSPQYRQRVIDYATEIAGEKVATAREELQQVYGDSATAAGVDLGRLLPLELESKRGGTGQRQGKKPVTEDEIATVMRQSGLSAEEVIQKLQAQGYQIEGLD